MSNFLHATSDIPDHKSMLDKRNVHDKCNSLPCPQLRTSVDHTITRSIPEIESTNDKMHTQAECITSLFPRLNNRQRDKHSYNGKSMSMRQSPEVYLK